MHQETIQIKEDKCRACYLCVRACPVKAIYLQENQVYPMVDHSACIGCGSCLSVCPYKAIAYENNEDQVLAHLQSGEEMLAICDPAIAGEFQDITDYRKFVGMLRMLGFRYVVEMSFGVDLISKKYADLAIQSKGKYYISSHCPALVQYIEKYYPDLINNLLPYVSPAAATALVARTIYGKDLRSVLISPCVAAKKDIQRNMDMTRVDHVLTFAELRNLFERNHIFEGKVEFEEFNTPLGDKGSLFPIPEGFVNAANLELGILESCTITASGEKDALEAIRSFEENTHFVKKNFNLFFCNGCFAGPGNKNTSNKYVKRACVSEYAKKRRQNFDQDRWNEAMQQFQADENLRGNFHNRLLERKHPDTQQIQEVLSLLKHAGKLNQVNCGLCGFNTCKNFAIAVAQGRVVPELCVAHSLEDAKRYSSELKDTDDNINKLKKTYEQVHKQLVVKELELIDQTNAFSIFVHRINPGVVIVNEQLKIIDSNEVFIDILGEDAREINEVIPSLIGADLKSLIPDSLYTQFSHVLTDRELIINRDMELNDSLVNVVIFQLIPNKQAGAIFRNLHSEQERPQEIITRVREVIDENLKQVQQMGFILGEGAAKTEKMLNSIIKSYNVSKIDQDL